MILIDKMPDCCVNCPLAYEDMYFTHNTPLKCALGTYAPLGLPALRRHKDCPLKSIDDLIEAIEKAKMLRCKDNNKNVFVSEKDLFEFIQKYCGLESDNKEEK